MRDIAVYSQELAVIHTVSWFRAEQLPLIESWWKPLVILLLLQDCPDCNFGRVNNKPKGWICLEMHVAASSVFNVRTMTYLLRRAYSVATGKTSIKVAGPEGSSEVFHRGGLFNAGAWVPRTTFFGARRKKFCQWFFKGGSGLWPLAIVRF